MFCLNTKKIFFSWDFRSLHDTVIFQRVEASWSQKNIRLATVGRYLFLNSRPCTDTLLAQSTPPASLGRVVHKRTFISEVSVVFSNPLSMRVEYRVSLIFVATHSNPVDSKSIILASHLDRAFIFSGNVNK